jgi:hypothetical protein
LAIWSAVSNSVAQLRKRVWAERQLRPTEQKIGYVSVSGVWNRARKPEGERDVGREWDRGILSSNCGTGRELNSAKFALPYEEEAKTDTAQGSDGFIVL